MKNCPRCGNSKFFYDRHHQAAFPESYAMCKFCGYWKKEGEDLIRCRMFFCGCHGSMIDRLGYDWNPGNQCNCQSCGKLLIEKDRVEWPVDNQNHPYHKL